LLLVNKYSLDPLPRSCPLCSSGRVAQLFSTGPLLGSLGIPGRLVICQVCKLIYKDFDSKNISLDTIYKGSDYSNEDWFASTDNSQRGEAINNECNRIISLILAKGIHSKDTLLDVGCGDGRFLSAAQAAGLKANGLEINPVLAQQARKSTTSPIYEMSLDQLSGHFSVVTAFEVVEHVLEPLLFYEQLVNRVREGGLVCLSTPNHASILPRLCLMLQRFGRFGGMANAQRRIFGSTHINFFEPDTLRKLIESDKRMKLISLTSQPFRTLEAGQKIEPLTGQVLDTVDTIGSFAFGGFRMLALARRVA